MTTKQFDFPAKRILKNKDHITINEGGEFQETVSHLKKNDDDFKELSKSEAAKLYADKKLTRDIDFKSREGVNTVEDMGLGNTPEWFDQVLPTIAWEDRRTFLYELDYLWLNIFFVRELFGEEKTGREQILELDKTGEGFTLNVLAQLDYNANEVKQYEMSDVDGFIKVTLPSEERDGGEEYDVDTEFKQTVFDEDQESVSAGLREILTGICLKHGYLDEQLKFSVEKTENEYRVDVLDKDFVLRFNESAGLGSGVRPWVIELFSWDGCPINVETLEVKN